MTSEKFMVHPTKMLEGRTNLAPTALARNSHVGFGKDFTTESDVAISRK